MIEYSEKHANSEKLNNEKNISNEKNIDEKGNYDQDNEMITNPTETSISSRQERKLQNLEKVIARLSENAY